MKVYTNAQMSDIIKTLNNVECLLSKYPSENSFNDIMVYSELQSQLKTLRFLLERHRFKDDKN